MRVDSKHLVDTDKVRFNDIERNRQRVKSAVNRFSQVWDDRNSRLWIIKQLAKELDDVTTVF